MADDAPEIMETDHEKKFLLDPYLDWVAAEGPPVHEDFGLDLLALETGPWPRFDAKGTFCHVKGRGDFCTRYLLELDPGRSNTETRTPASINSGWMLSPRPASPQTWANSSTKHLFEDNRIRK